MFPLFLSPYNSEGPYRCPVDNEEFVRSQVCFIRARFQYALLFVFLTCSVQVRKDRGCLKELQGLEIECTTQPSPCNWKGPLTALEVRTMLLAVFIISNTHSFVVLCRKTQMCCSWCDHKYSVYGYTHNIV